MAYVRRKRLKGHDYYYLVESYRQGGKVRTRTLSYLGRTVQPSVPSPAPRPVRRALVQGALWDELSPRPAAAQS